MKRKIEDYLAGLKNVGITGHIRPDGDCVGSCLALYNYLKENYPQINVELFLEPFSEKFMFLQGAGDVKFTFSEDKAYDLFIALDVSDKNRMGEAVKYFDKAVGTLSIDHHISNDHFADENVIVPEASSASEVLYGLLMEDKISKEVAECIYTGIVHDSGVFKYSNTSESTMGIAGKLLSLGIPFGKIIDESFYRKTYQQNLILGYALLESKLALDNKCVYTIVTKRQMKSYGVSNKDLDGIVDQLRVTEGVECAIFLYEGNEGEYKASLRSNNYVDVNKIAAEFGGGGHVRAAGCTLQGKAQELIGKILTVAAKQMNPDD